MASVTTSQVVVVPYFQGLNQIQESQNYANLINGSNKVFEENYKKEYSQIPADMEKLVQDWTADQATATEVDLATRIKDISEFEAKIGESLPALKKSIDAYKTTIKECQPPVLDKETLTVLKRMNVNLKAIEDLYVQLFDTKLKEMRDQVGKLKSLTERTTTAFQGMKDALEPTACRLKGGTFAALSYTPGLGYGKNAYVDHLLQQAKKPAPAPSAAITAEAVPL